MEYKLSYNYSELIQELHEEIADGILKYDDIIQIVRGETIEEIMNVVKKDNKKTTN